VTTAATDFAKVSLLDLGIIYLISILFAIHLGSCEIETVYASEDPAGVIPFQSVRKQSLAGVGFIDRLGIKTLIMDRSPVFTNAYSTCAKATAMLRSPNTVTLYDYGMSDSGSFYRRWSCLRASTSQSCSTAMGRSRRAGSSTPRPGLQQPG
jgi:hypothetical protein